MHIQPSEQRRIPSLAEGHSALSDRDTGEVAPKAGGSRVLGTDGPPKATVTAGSLNKHSPHPHLLRGGDPRSAANIFPRWLSVYSVHFLAVAALTQRGVSSLGPLLPVVPFAPGVPRPPCRRHLQGVHFLLLDAGPRREDTAPAPQEQLHRLGDAQGHQLSQRRAAEKTPPRTARRTT